MSYQNEEEDEAEKDTGMLLNLTQKSGIFVADQTPTPTRLIKNCEEVGLFEDLRNVNPFDETFRRACEQNVQNNTGSIQHFHSDENSLHTPQVFPQFDTAVEGGIAAGEDLSKQTLDTPVGLGVESVENILDMPQACLKPKIAEPCSIKYRAIAEKNTPINKELTQTGFAILPSCIQFVQPQLISISFPNNNQNSVSNEQQQQIAQTKRPFEKNKPLLLPKLSTTNVILAKDIASVNTPSIASSTTRTHSEPSSASLTPTSQLPIKERLKAILNQSNRNRTTDWPDKSSSARNFKKNIKSNAQKSSKDDAIERKRAASTRYRHKMRNEYKELRRRNNEFLIENSKLKERIKQLEIENTKLISASLRPVLASSDLPALGLPAQIHIPASTIHLVMNIPKMVIPTGSNDLNKSAKP